MRADQRMHVLDRRNIGVLRSRRARDRDQSLAGGIRNEMHMKIIGLTNPARKSPPNPSRRPWEPHSHHGLAQTSGARTEHATDPTGRQPPKTKPGFDWAMQNSWLYRLLSEVQICTLAGLLHFNQRELHPSQQPPRLF